MFQLSENFNYKHPKKIMSFSLYIVFYIKPIYHNKDILQIQERDFHRDRKSSILKFLLLNKREPFFALILQQSIAF